MADNLTLTQLLESWREAQAALKAIQQDAKTLWGESTYFRVDMLSIYAKAKNAQEALGDLPPGVLKGH